MELEVSAREINVSLDPKFEGGHYAARLYGSFRVRVVLNSEV
jgi:hypothetical protein